MPYVIDLTVKLVLLMASVASTAGSFAFEQGSDARSFWILAGMSIAGLGLAWTATMTPMLRRLEERRLKGMEEKEGRDGSE